MRQLMMHVFEPPGQVVWRGLHQLAHLVRRVLLQHVVDVLGVAGSHQRLDKGLRDGDERRAVGLQDGEVRLNIRCGGEVSALLKRPW